MATSAPITAEGLDVVIIGGGDTGTDCFGTALRQRAQSVVHVDIRARPPGRRSPQMPWPTYPAIYRTAPAHEEGGLRRFSLATLSFVGDGQHRLRAIQVVNLDHSQGLLAGIWPRPGDLHLRF